MLLGLSTVSSQGLWLLANDDATRVVASSLWNDDDSTGLSAQMQEHFDRLFAQQDLGKVTALYVVSGPGSFTGLRMGSAFMQGLARARNLPLRGVPTFALQGKTFFIPTRHQNARHLTLLQALEQGLDFLQLHSPTACEATQPGPGANIWGLADHPFWPSPEDLLKGIRASLSAPAGLSIEYGLKPKISGQR